MFVKLCGFTREEDLAAAAEFPLSAAGFVFHTASPRFVSMERARTLSRVLDGTGVLRVGVFTGNDADSIARTAEGARMDCAQVYDPLVAQRLDGRIRVITAYRVSGAEDMEALSRAPARGLLLLDRFDAGLYGGTGKPFDWEALRGFPYIERAIVAGGIDAANLGRLLALIRPYGIDVSSGIEDAPGIKSKEKIMNLFNTLREVYDEIHSR